mmetsp:Transcript_37801/g.56552  ORF Transcript_37801/g.56552 Transcript_37801/m.56552 type:complete len:205 (+) Transcript_37801:685-1299(+)
MLQTVLGEKVVKEHATLSRSHQVCFRVMFLLVALSSMAEVVEGQFPHQEEWAAAAEVAIWVVPLLSMVELIQTWTQNLPWLFVSVWKRREPGKNVRQQQQQLPLRKKERKSLKMGREWRWTNQLLPLLMPNRQQRKGNLTLGQKWRWVTKTRSYSRHLQCPWPKAAMLLQRKLQMKRNQQQKIHRWRKMMMTRMLQCNWRSKCQ